MKLFFLWLRLNFCRDKCWNLFSKIKTDKTNLAGVFRRSNSTNFRQTFNISTVLSIFTWSFVSKCSEQFVINLKSSKNIQYHAFIVHHVPFILPSFYCFHIKNTFYHFCVSRLRPFNNLSRRKTERVYKSYRARKNNERNYLRQVGRIFVFNCHFVPWKPQAIKGWY